MVLAEALQQPPGRIPLAGVKAKVQNSAGLETKTALFISELVAGHSEVEQDGIDMGDLQLLENLRDMRKIGLGQTDGQALAEGIESVDGRDVPVQGDDPAAGTDVAGHRKRVSAATERPVDDRITRLDVEGLKRFVEQNREVDGTWSRVHRAEKGWGWNVADDGHAMVLNPA